MFVRLHHLPYSAWSKKHFNSFNVLGFYLGLFNFYIKSVDELRGQLSFPAVFLYEINV